MPVKVILHANAALLGAASYALQKSILSE